MHLLLLTTHHIVVDGWSMTRLFQELAAIYPTLLRGRIDALPAAPCGQYTDYSDWQHARHRLGAFDEGLDYWTRALAEPPAPLDLAADRPRPAHPTFRGGSVRLRLSRDLTNGLKEIGRAEGASLFMTLAAAFALLLRRYSGASTLAIGTPMANRLREQDEGCIGFFANTLVLRCDLTGNPTFRDLLRRVRATTVEAFSHQDSPFEQVVERVNPVRDTSVNPLFQVMLALQPADARVEPARRARRLDRDPQRLVEVRPAAGAARSRRRRRGADRIQRRHLRRIHGRRDARRVLGAAGDGDRRSVAADRRLRGAR